MSHDKWTPCVCRNRGWTENPLGDEQNESLTCLATQSMMSSSVSSCPGFRTINAIGIWPAISSGYLNTERLMSALKCKVKNTLPFMRNILQDLILDWFTILNQRPALRIT